MMRSDETPPAEHASQTQTSGQPAVPTTRPKKKGILLPILLMIAPGLLIVASIVLYAVANFIMGTAQPAAPTDSSLFGEEAPNPARAITNTLLFLMGTISVLSVLPCFIIGLVLLIQRLQK